MSLQKDEKSIITVIIVIGIDTLKIFRVIIAIIVKILTIVVTIAIIIYFRIALYFIKIVYIVKVSYTCKKFWNFNDPGITGIAKPLVPNSYFFIFAD